jgi:methylphosphotriester-DNA--protein-cysteine methyltransferase
MKKTSKRATDRDTMRRQYDFSRGVRAKYAARFRDGTNLVVLDPDVAAAFKDSAAVNRALRAILDATPVRTRKKRTA